MKFCWLTTFPSVEMELKTFEHGMRICAKEAEDIRTEVVTRGRLTLFGAVPLNPRSA